MSKSRLAAEPTATGPSSASAHRHNRLGKILYGSLFLVLAPVALALWGQSLSASVKYPVPNNPPLAVGLVVFGLALMFASWVALWRWGHGLPMNAFPPSDFVRKGIYKYFDHPIYIGFTLLCAGISMVAQSSGGFWIVTPTVAVACLAIVLGYEDLDLEARFGRQRQAAVLSLPLERDDPPSFGNRFAVYFMVFLPWLLAYTPAIFIGVPNGAISLATPYENKWPVWQWTDMFYASAYLFSLSTPLLLRTSRQLRNFAVAGLIATGVGLLIFFLVPVVHQPRPFVADSLFGHLLELERTYDTPAAAFPSFHTIWAVLAAWSLSVSRPKWSWLWVFWGSAISIGCITTGMHSVIDVAAGAIVGWGAWKRREVWSVIRRATEHIANSWREWHVGPVRIINHSLYAGSAAVVCVLIVAALVPQLSAFSLMILLVSGILGGAIFAQVVEGSSRMLRPFGYFGAVTGMCLGVIIIALLPGPSGSQVLAACAVAAPFCQAVGRLRCVVQGCCHGRLTGIASYGIRCWHPSSRVVHLAELANKPIFPTPLYSIGWNLMLGGILMRFWTLGSPAYLIAGLYFVGAGLGRFIEEAYRGEPQTPVLAGLRLYHWWSIAFVLAGMAISSIHSARVTGLISSPWHMGGVAMLGGVLWGIAMGVDLPDSRRRFTRLTG